MAVVFIFAGITVADATIESEYKVAQNTNLKINCLIPVKVAKYNDVSVDNKLYASPGAKYDVQLKIFGIIPVKKASVEVVDDMYSSSLPPFFIIRRY